MNTMKNVSTKTLRYTQDELEQAVQFLAEHLASCAVFTFTGTLGAGKTTVIRQLLQSLGVKEVITSPTFTYVNIYTNERDETFYHFDCYRLATLDDFIQAGFGEYLYVPKSWSFIEWPEIVMPLLRENVCHVHLTYIDEMTREMNCRIVERADKI